jgi:hypothetical protein
MVGTKMKRPYLLKLAGRIMAGGLFAAFSGSILRPSARADDGGPMPGGSMMHGGMMGDSPADRHDMGTVMDLFSNHEKIRRTVYPLSNGFRAVTESDDPAVVALLHEHVAEMYQRVAKDQPFIMMSSTLPVMFRNRTKFTRHLEMTPKGVTIVETSQDPSIVKVIQGHAREVTGFVRDGMSAMMRGMMNR